MQGLGLYAARDIEKYTMVIEYIGTIIRNEVANRKEKMYEAQVCISILIICHAAHVSALSMCFKMFFFQNRGVYMFRIDSEHVIDATITGGPARWGK